ncbi:MAG: NADH-quinone oxidoreductase subunit E [Candidatus Cloacimonetes bacterium 4572_55]|nr:MAG: NADH-quinone oxidoreductase subunit E [Candidatus Cloacimonetes bacterium 4572_55]
MIIERDKVNQEIRDLKAKYGDDRSALLPILQDMQGKYGYLADIVMQETAHAFDIHPVEVEGVASFYSFLHTKKKFGKYVIRLCQTISCGMVGKSRVARQFENELGIKFGETTKDGMFSLEYTNCLGLCDLGPAVMINDQLYAQITPDRVPILIEECRNDFVEFEFSEVPRAKLYKKGPILEHGEDHEKVMRDALAMTREEIIETVQESRLKGRGGAGFPTAFKWKLAANEQADEKFVVCNADEGEPGTFKDRYLLQFQTDMILTGMTIAAYAIRAHQGFIYLRGEYDYLRPHIQEKIDAKKEKNFLGKNILGTEGFDFDITIRIGSGAYVCGEETALIESMEGFRGEPRNRPPYPVDTGFLNRPSIVNNVETFVVSALICKKGASWFNQHGTEKSSGTKLLSVSGDCARPGIYEFPFGSTIEEILKEAGGEDAKAVQVGGAAGHGVDRKNFGRKIGYEDMSTGGSIMIFGPDRDMLKVAKNFMEFFVEESCGQCVCCRLGSQKLLEGIEMLEHGRCSMAYLTELMKLGETMQLASKCGLGQSSPNVFLFILENFRNEMLGRLPSGGNNE